MRNFGEQAPTKKIEVPEGKMESPRYFLPIGNFNVDTLSENRIQTRKYELFIEKDENLDLRVKNEQGQEKVLIRMGTDFDDQANRHIGKMKVEDADLFAKFEKSHEFNALFDSYMAKVEDLSTGYLSKLDRESNNHKIRSHEIDLGEGSKTVEMIHQQQGGDCILANFLNTWSIENNGRVPFTIDEARKIAINLRLRAGEDASDIVNPNSPLSYKDVVNLFSSIHDCPPQQDDIFEISGENFDDRQIRLKVIEILDYLETYKSRTCSIGTGYHSRTIKQLRDKYIVLDPMDRNGIQEMDVDQIVDYLANQMHGRTKIFFFFLREQSDDN